MWSERHCDVAAVLDPRYKGHLFSVHVVKGCLGRMTGYQVEDLPRSRFSRVGFNVQGSDGVASHLWRKQYAACVQSERCRQGEWVNQTVSGMQQTEWRKPSSPIINSIIVSVTASIRFGTDWSGSAAILLPQYWCIGNICRTAVSVVHYSKPFSNLMSYVQIADLKLSHGKMVGKM